MGSIIKGTCKNCGYETESLLYGGGMRNFKTHCKYPVLDKVEKVVKMENIMEKDEVIKQNPNLIFYDNPALRNKDLKNKGIYHEWGEYKLYNEGYLCPKCNKFSFGFMAVGCWD